MLNYFFKSLITMYYKNSLSRRSKVNACLLLTYYPYGTLPVIMDNNTRHAYNNFYNININMDVVL